MIHATPLRTLYWRAMARLTRRSAAYRDGPTLDGLILVRDAARMANRLARAIMLGR